MVYSEANQRKTVAREGSESRIVLVALIVIFVVTGLFIVYYLVAGMIDDTDNIIENNIITNEESAYVLPEKTEVEPKKIDFQTVADNWAKNIEGDKGVLIYDLDRDEVVAEYNSNRSFATASLYKLFVVYEGYRKIELGEWRESDAAGDTGRTILLSISIVSVSDCDVISQSIILLHNSLAITSTTFLVVYVALK